MARERPGSLSWNPETHGDCASCGWTPHVEMISHFEGKSGTFLSLLVLWELGPLPDFIGKLQQKKLEIVSSARVLYSKSYTRGISKPDYFQISSALWTKTYSLLFKYSHFLRLGFLLLTIESHKREMGRYSATKGFNSSGQASSCVLRPRR